MKRCCQLLVNACQKQVAKEITQVIKIVLRRPKYLFSGCVTQQPTVKQQR